MSYLFKFFLIISSLYLFSSEHLLNQCINYNNNFFYKDSSFIEYYLIKYFNLTNLGFSHDFLEKFVKLVSEYWSKYKIIPVSYITNRNFSACVNAFTQSIGDNFDAGIIIFIESTGKYLNDLGNEYYCTSKINTIGEYYILESYFDSTEELTNYEDVPLLEFLNQNYFSIGICLPKDCHNIMNQLIHEKEFLDFLYFNLKVSNFSIYQHQDMYEKYKEQYKYGKYIHYGFVFIAIIKLFIGLLRTIIFTRGYERHYLDILEGKQKKYSISLVSMNSKKEEDSECDSDEKNENKKLIDNEIDKDELEKEKQNVQKKRNNSLPKKIKENENDIREIYVDYIYGSSSKNETNLYDPFYDNQDKYPFYLKLIKYLDLIDNIKILLKVSNKYYNSCIIKKIYFLKFLTMFLAILFNVMVNQIKRPAKNFLVYSFYRKQFFFIKLSVFSSIFWIVLDAVTTGFKLMSYIKKKIGSNLNYNLKFVTLIKFLLLLIPKIILFILCYLILHIHSNQLTYSLIDDNHLGPFIVYDNINSRYTYTAKYTNHNFFGGFEFLFPIWLNYLDYFKEVDFNKEKIIALNGSDDLDQNLCPNYTYYQFDKTGLKIPSPFLTNTELFINIYFNEFVLFLFMIIITYISYKLRKKIFDYFILAVNIILYIIPIFNWTKYKFYKTENNEIIYDKYNINFVLGQNFSEKYTHYFINFYYFGFLIGVMMFYYNENIFSKFNHINININNNSNSSSFDNVSSNSNINLLNIMPFSFCNDFVMGLNKLKFWIKRTILWISLIFITLLSFNFDMIQLYYSKNKINNEDKIINRKIKKVENPYLDSKFLQLIFLYEKNICGIFFFIFLLMLIVYPSKTNIIKFSQLNIFILFDRINFSFYCSYNFFVSAAFCVFYVEFKITLINILLISFGLLIILIIVDVVLVSMVELPLRMIIKTQMNKNTDKEFRITFSSMELLSPSSRSTVMK